MGAKLELKEVREPTVTKSLVRAILQSPHELDWSVQGLGMMRLYLDDHRRLHIWDSSLRVENVSDMHTHPWNFKSHVVVGQVNNWKYLDITEQKDHWSEERHLAYKKQIIRCGVGGGLVGEPEEVTLILAGDEFNVFVERVTYSELAHEIHVSKPHDGTITIVKREFLDDVDHALVFWKDGDWVSAEPRIATYDEVSRVTQSSLEKWF
jgi:hypothetical protein